MQQASAGRRTRLVNIIISETLALSINRALLAAAPPQHQQQFADAVNDQTTLMLPKAFGHDSKHGEAINWHAIGGNALK